jgi:hypothetical protein
MYGLRGVDSRNKMRGGAVIMHKEQFVYSMGLEQTGFCTQAIEASTSSKGNTSKKELQTHTDLYIMLYICFGYSTVSFSSLHVKNKPHVVTTNVHLFWDC